MIECQQAIAHNARCSGRILWNPVPRWRQLGLQRERRFYSEPGPTPLMGLADVAR